MESLQTDERLIAQLFDAQPDAVTWFVPVFEQPSEPERITDFRVQYCNTAAARFLNTTKDNVTGTLLTSDLMDETSRRRIFDQCVPVWMSGEAIEFTYHSPGLDRYFNVMRSKVAGGVLNVTRDRTELMRAQIEREHQAELLRKMMDIAPYGISIYESMRDANGNILDFRLRTCNQKAADISSFSVEDLHRYTVKELIGIRGPRADYFEACQRVAETGDPWHMEHYSPLLTRWFSMTMVKFEDGYLLNYVDVTHTKNLERAATEKAERLEQAHEILKRSHANLEQFAHMASHDLQEPLRKISIFVGQLRKNLEPALNDDKRQKFDRIENAAARMRTLIDDLLEYSQLSRDKIPFVPVDLNNVLHGVMTDLETAVTEKKAVVRVESLPVVKGNPSQLRHLFQNLISNALKYSKPNIQPEIIVTAQRETHDGIAFWLILVTDNGIGFEQEHAESIFGMFKRLHGKHEYSGTGIGLSIARKVAENHGGTITATSSPGMGTVFTVSLPERL